MAERYLTIPPLSPRDIKRFWSKVAKRGPDECWLWTANPGPQGYGLFSIGSYDCRMYVASRVAYAVAHGSTPTELMICHTCDRPGCVNPAHLYAGTRVDNATDMVQRGRNFVARGEANKQSKLTAEQVRIIRSRYRPRTRGKGTRVLAREFGVTERVIQLIVTGRSWTAI